MSAFSHRRVRVGFSQAVSLGELQFNLGVTAPPSSAMAASTARRKSAKTAVSSNPAPPGAPPPLPSLPQLLLLLLLRAQLLLRAHLRWKARQPAGQH